MGYSTGISYHDFNYGPNKPSFNEYGFYGVTVANSDYEIRLFVIFVEAVVLFIGTSFFLCPVSYASSSLRRFPDVVRVCRRTFRIIYFASRRVHVANKYLYRTIILYSNDVCSVRTMLRVPSVSARMWMSVNVIKKKKKKTPYIISFALKTSTRNATSLPLIYGKYVLALTDE